MAGQGEPHLPRFFAPGVAVLLGYVLLVGNPWLNRQLTEALYGTDSVLRVLNVMFSYPSWHVDLDRLGPFLFWFLNLRTLLFVMIAVAGLSSMSRWVRETTNAGLFVTTVGLTTLSAAAAAIASAIVVLPLVGERETSPFLAPGRPEVFFLDVLGSSATFGVLFGVVLGAGVLMQRRTPASRPRRVNEPKSFW